MISTVIEKGQVTLPKAIRDLLSISAGTRIDFEVGPGFESRT
jgi:AbrB family looped-hinge helix DNA binding protein